MPISESAPKFVRDGLTWLGYLLGASFAFCASAMGPLMPSLRADLHLSYEQAALHFSAWAIGGMLTGFFSDTLMRKLGRHKTLWGGAIGGCCGMILVITMPVLYLTVFGAFLAAFAGSLLGQTNITIMADRFGDERSIGITESNIAASTTSLMAPLVVGAFLRSGMPWRFALAFPLLSFAMLFFIFGRRNLPIPTQTAAEKSGGRLPPLYWIFWTIIFFSVGCEWSIIFWSADFLEHSVGLNKADAASSVSAFLIAMLIGRIIGSRLTRRYDIHVLLPIAAVIALTGFLTFWLAQIPLLNLFGLFGAGLGIANFYPLTLSAAIGAAGEYTTKATARLSIGTGLSVLVAPFVLGSIAERSNIFMGYGVVALMLALCTVMVVIANMHNRHTKKQVLLARAAAEKQ